MLNLQYHKKNTILSSFFYFRKRTNDVTYDIIDELWCISLSKCFAALCHKLIYETVILHSINRKTCDKSVKYIQEWTLPSEPSCPRLWRVVWTSPSGRPCRRHSSPSPCPQSPPRLLWNPLEPPVALLHLGPRSSQTTCKYQGCVHSFASLHSYSPVLMKSPRTSSKSLRSRVIFLPLKIDLYF